MNTFLKGRTVLIRLNDMSVLRGDVSEEHGSYFVLKINQNTSKDFQDEDILVIPFTSVKFLQIQ